MNSVRGQQSRYQDYVVDVFQRPREKPQPLRALPKKRSSIATEGENGVP